MKKINMSDMKPGEIVGEKGSVDVFDPLPDEIGAGVRVVKPMSYVPKKTHAHPEKQIIYVISGSGKITNGDEIVELQSGDFVLLESNEEHYVMTEDNELEVFEVKY